jgi:hypothetical protein
LGIRRVASCCVVGLPGVPCPHEQTASLSPSPSPSNKALVSTRSIVVRPRVHIRLACSKECPRNLEIRGSGSGSAEGCRTSARGSAPAPRSATQASSRGPDKAFLSNIKKRSVFFASTDPRSAAGEGAPTIAALSFPFIAVTTRGSAPGSRWCVRLCRVGIAASAC